MSDRAITGEVRISDRPAAPAAKRRHTTLWIAISILTLLLLAAGYFSNFTNFLSFDDSSNEPVSVTEAVRKMPVRVRRVASVDQISQEREYTGIIRAKQQADLGFELTGRVADIVCDEGDYVEADKILAHLDIKTLKARRAATAAGLAQATAVLAELTAGPRRESIESMRAKVAEASSELKIAELSLERRKKLRESNSISTEEYQQSYYGVQAAQSQVESAQKQLDELEAGTRPEKITAQNAVMEQFQATLAEIDVQIEKSSIVAPFAGKIVQRMADPGGIVTPSQPILKLVDTDNLEAVIGLPAIVASNLELEQPFVITIAGTNHQAHVLAKIQRLEMTTRTRNVVFQMQSTANGEVLPGQLCQISIASDIQAQGIWVPASSLTNGIRGLWSLMVVDEENNRARRRDVEVVYTDGDRVLVRGTLEDGALVIIDGTHRIVDGQAIEIVLDTRDSVAAERSP